MVEQNNKTINFQNLRKELTLLYESFLGTPEEKWIHERAKFYDKEFGGLSYYKEEFSFGDKIPLVICNAINLLFEISFYDLKDKRIRHYSNEDLLIEAKKILEDLKKEELEEKNE